MLIKKNKNKNEYYVQDGIFVRNPFLIGPNPVDLNKFYSYSTEAMVENENINLRKNFSKIESENFKFNNIIIINDGLDFVDKQHLLSGISKDTAIIAVNRALKYWTLIKGRCTSGKERVINFYVINNPYEQALSLLPEHSYTPRCIAATTTNSEFLSQYDGLKYLYTPVFDGYYSSISQSHFKVDDYHNPICAAISLAVKFSAKKILLFCCDVCFKENRLTSVQAEDGLYCYPPQIKTNVIVDGIGYWLNKNKIKIYDHSSGVKYQSIPRISEQQIIELFN